MNIDVEYIDVYWVNDPNPSEEYPNLLRSMYIIFKLSNFDLQYNFSTLETIFGGEAGYYRTRPYFANHGGLTILPLVNSVETVNIPTTYFKKLHLIKDNGLYYYI